jgi:replicative superfamily II helicase
VPQKCSICSHPDRLEIEREMVSGTGSLRDIAGRFKTSKTALSRHRAHISECISATVEAQALARSGTLLEDVHAGRARAEKLYQAAVSILENALQESDAQNALGAIRSAALALREARSFMALTAEVTGEIKQNPANQIMVVMPATAPGRSPLEFPGIIDLAMPRR